MCTRDQLIRSAEGWEGEGGEGVLTVLSTSAMRVYLNVRGRV